MMRTVGSRVASLSPCRVGAAAGLPTAPSAPAPLATLKFADTYRHSSSAASPRSFNDKRMGVEDAVRLVKDGDTLAVSGFVAQSPPEAILRALGQRYSETQSPKDLTLYFHGGPGDWGERGLNHLAQPGMLKKTIGSHYGQTPKIAAMVQGNEIDAYNVPMGTICRMVRAGGSGRAGYSTTVGMGTMADPRMGGGRLNERTTADLAKLHTNATGVEVLFYPAAKLDVAVIRGTTADPDGNITMERESLYLDVLNQAMAARSNGGLVLCQVERFAARGSLNPRLVRVPGALVDVVVVAENQAEDHPQSFFTNYNPAFAGEIRVPMDSAEPMALDNRKIIARRAALNLIPGQVVNLGIGMPEGVAKVAAEEGVLDQVALTTEPGTHGGLGASGHDFGPATNYSGMLEMHQQFDFYNGGGLDVCFLGMAEVTAAGDVNVTRVGKTLTGPGGFIDISQCTQRVNLLGTLTAGGLKTKVKDGKLEIVHEGRVKKFVKSIPEVTFSGAQARKKSQIVKYITERCVFTLGSEGLLLSEVAPGIDIQRDILDQMEFTPVIRGEPRVMDACLFREGLMGLSDTFNHADMSTRLVYVEDTNTVFADLSGIQIRTSEELNGIVDSVAEFFEAQLPESALVEPTPAEKEAGVAPTKRGHMEVNYFRFGVPASLEPQLHLRASELEAKYYLSVRRHTGRTFSHLKAAQPRQTPPATLTVADAVAYVQRHQIPVAADDVKHAFDFVANGRTELGRDEFGEEVLSRLERKFTITAQE